MKFDFSKSISTDLQNKISINKLDIINKNLLYLTHQSDKILSIVNILKNTSNLQKQVDDYFEEDEKNIPEDKEPD